MPRTARIDLSGVVYHVINRSNARTRIFKSEEDFELFESILIKAKNKFKVSIFTYSLMPNHIHLALMVDKNGELGKFMHWLTSVFTQSYHRIQGSIGNGHLFQSRYKAFIVRSDRYMLQLFIYIERNALKANLVNKAQDWRWSSLWLRAYDTNKANKLLSKWPINRPKNYLELINQDIIINRDEIGLSKKKLGRPKWK